MGGEETKKKKKKREKKNIVQPGLCGELHYEVIYRELKILSQSLFSDPEDSMTRVIQITRGNWES